MRNLFRGSVLLVTVLLISSGVLADNTYQGLKIVNVVVDGRPLRSDVPAVNLNGRTVLPLRTVAEVAGMDVQWDPVSNTATLTSRFTLARYNELESANRVLTSRSIDLQKDKERLTAELATAKKDLASAQADVKRLTAAAPTKSTSATTSATPAPPALKTVKEIQDYLQANLASVTTPAGNLNLTFRIVGPNDSNLNAYDYSVWVDWDPSWYFMLELDRLEHSLTAPPGGRAESINILKAHSQKIYEVVAKSLPGKKIEGSFFRSWYRYPSIEEDYQIETHLRWQNYDEGPSGSGKTTYANATLSQFHFTSNDK